MLNLIANLRKWASILDGLDDPQGEYLLRLERRIKQLEDLSRDQPGDAGRTP